MRFNGRDPRELSPKVFPASEVIGAIPPRDLRTLETGQGLLIGGADWRGREIKLTLNFAGRSHEHANELASSVAALFGRGVGEYEPTHMPGRAFSAVLREAGDMEWRLGFGTVDYTFVAPRPFSHSTAETVVNGTGSVRMEPRGHLPARPVLKHTMAAAASALTFRLGGVPFLRLRMPDGSDIPQGAVLRADFENRLVTLNGEARMTLVDYTATNWHPALSGGCLIVCSDAGATEARWRDEWM